MAPQTFHPFSHLAPELQELIWLHAISSIGPRVVELRDGFWTTLQPSDDPQAIVSAGGQVVNTTDAGLQKWEWQFTSPCFIPPPLHTCSLSRELALRRWRLAFGTNEEGETRGQAKIFFDFEKDVIWIGKKLPAFRHFMDASGSTETRGLKKLAIGFDEQVRARGFRSGADLALFLMNRFPLLEEIVLIGSERKGGSEGDYVGDRDKKRGMVTFVENVDGAEDAFWVTRGVELDVFRDVCRRQGRHKIVLKYMDYTRDDPESVQMVDKLQWLQMED
jgi:hypothetical protein